MKISTALLFDRATERIGRLETQLATRQAQLSTGKELISPSDAPDKASAINRLRSEVERNESSVKTLTSAMQRYQAEEVSLKGISDILMRMQELTILAANDTNGPTDRKIIAAEMSGLREQMVALGNSRDDTGNYIFAGTRVGTAPLVQDEQGRVSYVGDQTKTIIPAGVERSVGFTRSATDVFNRLLRTDDKGDPYSVGFFESIDQTIQAMENNDVQALRRGLGEMNNLQDSINLALVKTGTDQTVVESQVQVLEETALRLKTALSDMEDLNYAEAVARMNKEMLALQSAMASFGKIAGLTLFDYIGR
jgi:flagellar hook-associated protein 3 FlgL